MTRAARAGRFVAGVGVALLFGSGLVVSQADVAAAVPLSDTATNSTDLAMTEDSVVDVPLEIDTAMTITNVKLQIDFAKVGAGGSCGPPSVNGSAPPRNDSMFMQLFHPDQNDWAHPIYYSFSYSGESGFGGTVTMEFTETASGPPSSVGVPATGSYLPEFGDMDFDGSQAAGTWILRINRGFEFTTLGGPLCFYEARLTVQGDGEAPPPATSATICVRPGMDVRAPYADGSCPVKDYYVAKQVVPAPSGGVMTCRRVGTDLRAPYANGSCPVNDYYKEVRVATVASGGVPTCFKVGTDIRAPYANGTCPAGFAPTRLQEVAPAT